MRTEALAFIKAATQLLNHMRAADTFRACATPTPDGRGVCQKKAGHPEDEPHLSLQIISWGNTPRALTDLAQDQSLPKPQA